MYEIYKNVFYSDTLYKILGELKRSDFAWYYRNAQLFKKEEDTPPYFGHDFYEDNMPNSGFYESVITPFYEPLQCKSLINARANLVINQGKHVYSAWHRDRHYRCKTAIWYANSCNGYTELKDDDESIVKINCEENQLLIFDSYHQHRAVSQTDTKNRIVINFNFFNGEEYV